MALPASGAITIGNVQTQFGGTNPAQMSEYYSGGAYVTAGTTGGNGSDGVSAGTTIPTSGTIKLANFYNASAPASMTIGAVNIPYVLNKTFDYYDSIVAGTQSNVTISVTSNINCRIQLFAGGGGPSLTSAGSGGGIQFTYNFTTGNTYTLALGLGGTTGGGGSPGGGSPGVSGAGGGAGYSAIFVGTPTQANVIAICGAGGGGAFGGTSVGQGGSGNTAGVSVPLNGLNGGVGANGGSGGSGTAGGSGGVMATVGSAGSALAGGAGAINGSSGGGGGGGGYYGGGGGGSGGGTGSGGGGAGSGNIRLGATFESAIANAVTSNPRGTGAFSGRTGAVATAGTVAYGSGMQNIGNWLAPWCPGSVGTTLPTTGYSYVLTSALNPGDTSCNIGVQITTSASSTSGESVLRFGANYGRFFSGGTQATPAAQNTTMVFTISGTTYTKICTAALQTTTNVNLTTTLGVAVPAGTVVTVYVNTILVTNTTGITSATGSSAGLFRLLEPRGTYHYLFSKATTGGNTTPVNIEFAVAAYPITAIPAGTALQRTNTDGVNTTASLQVNNCTKAGFPGSIRITML